MRLFVSIEPPIETVDYLESCIGSLSEANKRMPIKWSDRTMLHSTVLFLGEVEEGLLQKIESSLTTVAESFHEFFINLLEPELFFKKKKPSIIYMKLFDQSGIFTELHTALRNEYSSYLALEDKPFSPHITLGRVKGTLPYRKKVRIDIGHIDSVFPVSTVHLLESTLTRIGPLYSKKLSVDLIHEKTI